MSVLGFDVGFVSTTTDLVDFYVAALGLEVLETREFPMGTVHRLRLGPGVLKVMVPHEAPEVLPVPAGFWARAGLRYLTLYVDDAAAVVDRWSRAGGRVVMEPAELRPGVRVALLADPDGNALEVMQDTS